MWYNIYYTLYCNNCNIWQNLTESQLIRNFQIIVLFIVQKNRHSFIQTKHFIIITKVINFVLLSHRFVNYNICTTFHFQNPYALCISLLLMNRTLIFGRLKTKYNYILILILILVFEKWILELIIVQIFSANIFLM